MDDLRPRGGSACWPWRSCSPEFVADRRRAGARARLANAGPEADGGQFFLVYGGSTLPPDYAVFGSVEETGRATLDTIAARGIDPGRSAPEGGPPARPVRIESATVG